jgi:hypothetical protein
VGRIGKEAIMMHITYTDAGPYSCGYEELHLLGNNAVYSEERLNRRFGATYRLQLTDLQSMPSYCLLHDGGLLTMLLDPECDVVLQNSDFNRIT